MLPIGHAAHHLELATDRRAAASRSPSRARQHLELAAKREILEFELGAGPN
jgi:hypothetical protein